MKHHVLSKVPGQTVPRKTPQQCRSGDARERVDRRAQTRTGAGRLYVEDEHDAAHACQARAIHHGASARLGRVERMYNPIHQNAT